MLKVITAYRATGKLTEKYNVDDTSLVTGGGEYPTQDGFGWTNGVLRKLLVPHPSAAAPRPPRCELVCRLARKRQRAGRAAANRQGGRCRSLTREVPPAAPLNRRANVASAMAGPHRLVGIQLRLNTRARFDCCGPQSGPTTSTPRDAGHDPKQQFQLYSAAVLVTDGSS
jgi:Trehalase